MAGEETTPEAADPTPIPTPTPAPTPNLPALKVNTQIVDAVAITNAVNVAGSSSTGAGVAYQKVSQAAAFAVQDATDYLRNVMTMSATAQGMALKLFVQTKDAQYAEVVKTAALAVTDAQAAFAQIGAAAGTVVTNFPSGSKAAGA